MLILVEGKYYNQFTHKLPKNTENTVLGYKNGSKFESDIRSRSTTQKFYIVIFATFAWKWPEHAHFAGEEILLPIYA